MDIGFETIGNAILICHDRRPVLVTDPWLSGNAYFGSWTFSHEIPDEQLASIQAAEYAWVSHGHPDHLNLGGIRRLGAKNILVSDHVGGRVAAFLREQGYPVVVLTDRKWYRLSDRIRILSVADYNQDSILLIDIGGRLIVNLNDASDRGWLRFVRSVVRRYDTSILMCLSGFGDADMINVFDDDGNLIPPPAARREPVGRKIAAMTRKFGVTHFVPFSSMHRYQRSDSVWANEYTTRLEDYSDGFDSRTSTLLPPFIRYDCAAGSYEEIKPPERPWLVRGPEDFGDTWTDQLEAADSRKIAGYFRSISHLSEHFDFIKFRVGGRDDVVPLVRHSFGRGITFEVPRNSLMTAIEHEVFDDLLLGNFMRTTVHGQQSPTALYPDFSPYVAKYADNAGARSEAELRHYFAEYRKRAPFEYLHHRLERRAKGTVRSVLHRDSAVYRITRQGYRRLRGW